MDHSLLAYGPLASGRLSGAMRPGHTFGDDDWRSGRGEFARWRDEGPEWAFDPEPLARTLGGRRSGGTTTGRAGPQLPAASRARTKSVCRRLSPARHHMPPPSNGTG